MLLHNNISDISDINGVVIWFSLLKYQPYISMLLLNKISDISHINLVFIAEVIVVSIRFFKPNFDKKIILISQEILDTSPIICNTNAKKLLKFLCVFLLFNLVCLKQN